MICSANTNVGMKREINQDNFMIRKYTDKTTLCVVCDGMGGIKGGEEASKIAAESFVQTVDQFIIPYLKNKQNAAEIRKKEAKIRRLTSEMEKLEAELSEIEELMSGEAATDYKKLAELDNRKNEIEERLLEIYEELE